MHSINEILHCRVFFIKLDPGILVNTFDINENGYYYALAEEKIVLQYCIF